ncbi:ditrans,polycis-polyprenyl diphosphate synthase [Nematocida minor]|uniref:ditrans,polycis-polyprenyl diphosphate synthase n=1 Tax=Nematocida minor TaxID=1912983 RepID=UPI00221E5EAB|nr:ditrans,polycis-polyprenyl diphosphate synthase [Nematocida minor]KAI5192413.1 ditrans,polycis-polyprenyl diphosphate synthase [Nematocida minor]
MSLLDKCSEGITLLTLNIIDGILESQRIARMHEFVRIHFSWIFIFSSLTERIVEILSKLIVPRGLAIAVIMDGNRRYAKSAKISRKSGHMLGYKHMLQTLKYLKAIECKSVGLFAFGKKNYNRSPEEISDIMQIFESAFTELETSNQRELKEKLAIVGDVSSMPSNIATHVKRINKDTGTKKSCFIFVSYSSIDEYVNTTTDGITVPFDIIMRPGGEKRLSDFLLCNAASRSTISFMATKWPLMSSLHILLSIMKYRLEKTLQS